MTGPEDSGDPDELFRVRDYEGTMIACSVSRWNDHIVANHPELEGRQGEVAETIREPEVVLQDRDYGDRKHHIRGVRDRLFVNVVTEYRYGPTSGEVSGLVITAFTQSRLRTGDRPLYMSVRR